MLCFVYFPSDNITARDRNLIVVVVFATDILYESLFGFFFLMFCVKVQKGAEIMHSLFFCLVKSGIYNIL